LCLCYGYFLIISLASVRAIIRRGDKVLVEWLESREIAFLPGGTVEGDEDLLDALRRELLPL